MINNTDRIGNFTSSEIYKLMSNGRKAGEPGAPFYDYIQEKKFERKLGRSIDSESNARPLSWGKICEVFVFQQLGIRYHECSKETIVHPTIKYFAGSPDGTKEDDGVITLAEIKSPSTLKSFCQFAECKTIEEVRENHKSGEQYFWQMVANSILTNAKFAELIVFAPMYSHLNEIRALAQKEFEQGNSACYWIAKGSDDELPYLLESGQYNNLNTIRFEVLQSDKDLLTTRVLEAGKLLIELSAKE